ncbi:MAG: proton-conducting transporter membrane subunit [Fidelibacterota bacterium]
MGNHLLLITLFLPLIGALIILFIKEKKSTVIRSVAAIVCGLQLWIVVQLLTTFDKTATWLQFGEHIRWIDFLDINFIIGIDGINLVFLNLSGIIFLATVFISRQISNRQKSFYTLLMILNIGITGVLIAFDLFLFLMFYGLTLFSMFLLVTLFPAQESDIRSGHFGMNVLISFCLMIIGILILNHQNPNAGFNLVTFMRSATVPGNVSTVGFFIVFIGFLFITPVFPFHSWLAATANNTIIPVAILVLSIFSQIGIFGMLHIVLPLFAHHATHYAILFSILGLIGILYYAVCVFSFSNFKKITTYAAGYLNGFVFLGLAALLATHHLPDAAFSGLNGAVIQTVASALLIMTMLLIPKAYQHIITAATATVNHQWPLKLIIILILCAAIGLPGFPIFVGQFLCLTGSFQVLSTRIISIVALAGLIIVGIQFFRIIRSIVRRSDEYDFSVNTAEIDNERVILPLVLSVLFICGIFPNLILKILDQSIHVLIQSLTGM